MKLILTNDEIKIFNYLLKCKFDFNLKTTIRIAGGWVRDKILGIQSNDIDIVLDDMTGEKFAKLLTKKVNIIKINPEKSKHLETATISLFGYSIDICNLRREDYDFNCRIPKTTFSNALDDSFRRDFTINSLFYNIETKKIEDLTKLGLDDIKNKLIRTPINPSITFKDDPLRILRAIRFSGRFEYSLHEDIISCLKDKKLIKQIKTKVSPERIGSEIFKMFSMEKNSIICINLLLRFKIFPIIFGDNFEKIGDDFIKHNYNFDIESLFVLFFYNLEEDVLDFLKNELAYSKKFSSIINNKIIAIKTFVDGINKLNRMKIGTALTMDSIGNEYDEFINLSSIISKISKENLRRIVNCLGLNRIWKKNLFFDGKKVMEKFDVKGKGVGLIMSLQRKFMYLFPNLSSEDFVRWYDKVYNLK